MIKAPKPVLLLDVDGVINACCTGDHPTTWPKETWTIREINGFPIRWAQGMVDKINQLAEVVEVRWHTTWLHDAITHIAPNFGFKPFPVAFERDFSVPRTYGEGWWKTQAALDVATIEKRPLIWLDDDLAGYEQRYFWKNVPEDTQALLIAPYTTVGLTPEHFNEIDRFIEENS